MEIKRPIIYSNASIIIYAQKKSLGYLIKLLKFESAPNPNFL